MDIPPTSTDGAALRRAVRLVALLNLGYFGVEFAVALGIGSVSLFADSIDFLEDTAINGLILVALGWSPHRRALVGMALAAILLAPGLATLWTAWEKFAVPVPPAPVPLSLAGCGALAINLFCAFLLARFRAHSGSLTRAAFLSARNDAWPISPSSPPAHHRHDRLALARLDCRSGDFRDEPRCGTRSLHRRPPGALASVRRTLMQRVVSGGVHGIG